MRDLKTTWHQWVVALALPLLATSAAAQSTGSPNAAKEAAAVLIDNKPRLFKLTRRHQDLLNQRKEDSEIEGDIEFFIRVEALTEIRRASNSITVAKELLTSVYADVTEAAKESLNEMVHAQENQLDLATTSHLMYSASEYGTLVRQQIARFDAALRSLPGALTPTANDRKAAIEKHRYEIFVKKSEAGAASEVEKPISATEYAKKKMEYDEWLGDQERRARERRKRETARREEQRKRHEATGGERDIPKAGLSLPDDPGAKLADTEEMKAWHDGYAAEVVPVKQALGEFLKVQGTVRTEIMLRACQDLSRATAAFLETEATVSSPDQGLTEALRAAFNEFKTASDSCVLNQLRNMRHHVTEGKRALARAAEELKPYSLGL